MTTPLSTELVTLGQYLAGEFENRAQSLAEPTWYVHLKLWHRPVPLFREDSLTFFVEQVSVAAQTPPYRQRILRLQQSGSQQNGSQLNGQYYGLKNPIAYRGGALDPALLAPLSPDELIDLPTCRVDITPHSFPNQRYRFVARMPANTLGSFESDGTTRYVSLGFDVGVVDPAASTPTIEFQMFDKGIDPATGQGLWGALMGPFRLIKQVDWAH